MATCIAKLSNLVCLFLTAVALSAAAPVSGPRSEQDVQELPKHFIISQHTGDRVHVHEDGNVTARAGMDGSIFGKFFIRDGGNGGVLIDSTTRNISFHSVDFNGSYLHFIQVVDKCRNGTNVTNGTNGSCINGTDCNTNDVDTAINGTAANINGTAAIDNGTASSTDNNDTAINCTEWMNETSTPLLKLVLGEINEEDEEIIRHHMWTEEHAGRHFVRYSVTLDDGTVCYLAFEMDGTPVENPCLDKTELNGKEMFFLFPAF